MYLDGRALKVNDRCGASRISVPATSGDANTLFLSGQLYWKGEYAERHPELAMKTLNNVQSWRTRTG